MKKDLIQKGWEKKVVPPFRQDSVDKIAKDMVEICAKVKSGQNAMIFYDPYGVQLAEAIAALSTKKGARVWYYQREMKLDKVLALNSSSRDIERSQTFLDAQVHEADVVFLIRAPEDPLIMGRVPEEKMKMWSAAQRQTLMNYRVNYTNWCLIYWPTPAEAMIEDIPYEKYVELFFSACNQPWVKIKESQKFFVHQLNKAKQIELFANPNDKDVSRRTHLTIDIGPMTFANTTIDVNYPGSEVFSSPERHGVNGQIFAAGVYAYEGKRMEDILLKVKDGKIVVAHARKGQNFLESILDRDEGARYFGEIAFGTNPGLRRRLFNPLLNEKVGGSFHITPGKAYEMTEFEGEKVKLDNGNRSLIHWDITIMMLPQYGGGEIRIDGKTVQKDGRFLDPRLKILNEGLTSK